MYRFGVSEGVTNDSRTHQLERNEDADPVSAAESLTHGDFLTLPVAGLRVEFLGGILLNLAPVITLDRKLLSTTGI